jgi:hypothetical protein
MKLEFLKKHDNKGISPTIMGIVSILIIFSGALRSEAAPIGQCKNNLNIIQTQQIDFGDLIANTGGVVTLDTNNARTVSGTVLPIGSAFSGVYDISATIDGCDAYYVSISITPDPVPLSGVGVDMSMTTFGTRPTGFASDPINLSPLANVPVQIYIGADLTVGNGQVAGTYNAAPFSVTATLTVNPPK